MLILSRGIYLESATMETNKFIPNYRLTKKITIYHMIALALDNGVVKYVCYSTNHTDMNIIIMLPTNSNVNMFYINLS